MGIRLNQEEIDEFIENGHTLIFSTVDKEGYPHSTPVWYVYRDGHMYTRGRDLSQKAKNIDRNPKVCALVESGQRWRDLKAVMIRGRAEVVTDTDTKDWYDDAINQKYINHLERREDMPKATKGHYSREKIYWRIIPEKRISTWDNQKIRGMAKAD